MALRSGGKALAGGADGGDAVAVWIASVVEVENLLDQHSLLSAGERAHAEGLRQLADRGRYRASRALLRHALSCGIGGVQPAGWRFELGRHGKPIAAKGLPAGEFSLSHAGECVAVAIGRNRPVGVDVECLEPDERAGIVDDVLTDSERELLRSAPPGSEWSLFVRLWTLKEAGAKALGLGAAIDFRELEVSLDPLAVRRAGDATEFEVASSTLSCAGMPYCLSVAALSDRRRGAAPAAREAGGLRMELFRLAPSAA